MYGYVWVQRGCWVHDVYTIGSFFRKALLCIGDFPGTDSASQHIMINMEALYNTNDNNNKQV